MGHDTRPRRSLQGCCEKPNTGIAGRCASAASGHAAPPASVMNSRRLIRSLRQRARIAEYKYAGIAEKALKGLAGLEPADADPSDVARQIVRVVDLPFGERVHVVPSQDDAEIVNAVGDRMRREMYRNIGLEDLLHPTTIA